MLGYTATLAWYTNGTAGLDMSWVDTAKPGGGTNPAFAFTDANGNDRTGALVFIKTGIGSQALPISITAGGNGVQMDTTGALSAIGSGQIIATNLAKYLQNCGTLTTTASTTDALSCAWVTTSSNCTATQNSTGTIVAFTAVVPTAGTVTVTHTATSGGTYAIACSVD
jgi:hypothetical protein